MKVFFDTEFTGLQKDTNLISIGFVDENDNELYLEIKDTDVSQVDNWIKENVLDNTINWGNQLLTNIVLDETKYKCVTKQEAKDIIEEYFSNYDFVELVSDVCYFDMVLLIDIFGSSQNIPENVSCACHDINQDIAEFENITEYEAFNMSREEFLDSNNITISGNKHNSLYDAKVIKEIYNIISMYK